MRRTLPALALVVASLGVAAPAGAETGPSYTCVVDEHTLLMAPQPLTGGTDFFYLDGTGVCNFKGKPGSYIENAEEWVQWITCGSGTWQGDLYEPDGGAVPFEARFDLGVGVMTVNGLPVGHLQLVPEGTGVGICATSYQVVGSFAI